MIRVCEIFDIHGRIRALLHEFFYMELPQLWYRFSLLFESLNQKPIIEKLKLHQFASLFLHGAAYKYLNMIYVKGCALFFVLRQYFNIIKGLQYFLFSHSTFPNARMQRRLLLQIHHQCEQSIHVYDHIRAYKHLQEHQMN